MFYRRNLPYWIPPNATIFLTFRLAGSLPGTQTTKSDGLRHEVPMWLLDDRVAAMVSEAILYGQAVGYYELFAWVVMPNHVHMRISRTGSFWQDESFDPWIRSWEEFEGFVDYIESNAVRAGLAESPQAWKWSSAVEPRLIQPTH